MTRVLEPGVGGDPTGFLGQFEGRPRGFWGRGDRWVAWGEALAEVTLPTADPDRFGRIRREVEALVGGAAAEGGVRLFGGLSFLEAPSPNGSWRGFPVARFLLPRVVLQSTPDETRLRIFTLGGEGGGEEAEEDAERHAEAEALASALHEAALGGGVGTPPPEPVEDPGESSVERGEGAWTTAVEAVLAAGARGEVEKAVLARTRDVTLPRPVSVPRLLRFLRHENLRAHVFVMEPDPGRILFGAAPEILAELRGGRFHATAVAGSAPRGRTAHEEQLLAGGLLASAKDRAEHRMTLEEMLAALTPRTSRLRVPDGPGVLTLARIQHLETPIHGVAAPGVDILDLVEALHPTPAVCGRPRGRALALIREAEPFERGWYAGPVGWLNAAGDGDFVPALRIGVGGGTRWRLYAGAGIVEGSDPHSEWEETALKFEPAHRALRAAMEPAPPSGAEDR